MGVDQKSVMMVVVVAKGTKDGLERRNKALGRGIV